MLREVFVFLLADKLIAFTILGGGEIAQSLASLSTRRAAQVRSRLNLLVSERWNSITVIDSLPPVLVKKRPSMCYYVCVIMHIKDPQYG